jgi:hypothetical protein
MTGSTLLFVLLPIVVVIALAGWLAMMYYADAHPGWKAHTVAPGLGVTGTVPQAEAGQQLARRGVSTVARRDADADAAGAREAGPQAPAAPHRRVA